MLIDIPLNSYPILDLIVEMEGNDPNPIKLETGVYEIGHFSLDSICSVNFFEYPQFENIRSYGVCDDYKQVIEKAGAELSDESRRFVMSVTPVKKANQPSIGGWRWHKWGPYIGNKEVTTEYLYDEPFVEKVYVYKIIEIC